MSNLELESVIEDSLNDAVAGIDEPEPVVDSTPAVEAEPVSSDGTAEAIGEPAPSTQVTPNANAQTPEEPEFKDPFADLVGMPQMGVTGRENRIPYSRVKKITEKSASDAETHVAEVVLGRKLNQGEKAVDAVKAFAAQVPELTTKVQDYEGRLNTVGQFEQVMANQPEKFLQMLAKLPAYKQFFTFVENAYNTMSQNAAAPVPTQPAPGQQPIAAVPLADEMPQPDEKLADGSAVYSMAGLQKLVSWTQAKAREQAVAEATGQFNERYSALEQRYAPIMQAWTEYQTRQSVLPQIQAQIAEAKTWPMFNELENEITQTLQADRTLTLEAAYRKVAFPKMIAERNNMRQDIIKELQTAPTSTAVSGRSSKPNPPTPAGPRSLEDIIKEQLEGMGNR